MFEAAFSKGLHAWMAERSWLVPGTKAGWEGLFLDHEEEGIGGKAATTVGLEKM